MNERELRRLDSKYYEKLTSTLYSATTWTKVSSSAERLIGWDFCMDMADMLIEVLNDIGVHEYALESEWVEEMKYRLSMDGEWIDGYNWRD